MEIKREKTMIPNLYKVFYNTNNKEYCTFDGKIKLEDCNDYFKETLNLGLVVFNKKSEVTIEHKKTYDYIIDNQKDIFNLVIDSLFEEYPKIQEESMLDDELMPNIKSADELIQMIKPVAIEIYDNKNDEPHFGIEFNCTWDEEHGVGVQINGTDVISIGSASDMNPFDTYNYHNNNSVTNKIPKSIFYGVTILSIINFFYNLISILNNDNSNLIYILLLVIISLIPAFLSMGVLFTKNNNKILKLYVEAIKILLMFVSLFYLIKFEGISIILLLLNVLLIIILFTNVKINNSNNIDKANINDLINKDCKQKYLKECKYIWKQYVSEKGDCEYLQGELLRELEVIRNEAQKNGNTNWDNNLEHYCHYIQDNLCSDIHFSQKEKNEISTILNYFIECGNYAKSIKEGKISKEDADMNKIAYTNNNLYDIIADAIGKFQKYNPKPIYLKNLKI